MREGKRKATKEKTYLGHLNKSQKDESKEAKKFDREQAVNQFSKCNFSGEVRKK